MITFDKTLDIMEKEFVGLTDEEKFALGQKRGFFSILESEADNKLKELKVEYTKHVERLQKSLDKINYLIKCKQEMLDANNKNKE